jgi:Transposase IS116/IS110/IS902 family
MRRSRRSNLGWRQTAASSDECGFSITSLGDLSRFANPRQLMAYLGLVPSEHSSGASIRRGGLTKAGNSAARRLLIEAPWSYRFPARVSRELRPRREDQPKAVCNIAWNGQIRLCARYRKLARSSSQPMSSLPRLPANWRGLSGPSPAACRRQQADRRTRVIAARAGGASEPSDPLLAGKAGGTVAVRRTLSSTICRIADPTQVPRPRQLRDASPVMRSQPAHQSMINRRFDDRAGRVRQAGVNRGGV